MEHKMTEHITKRWGKAYKWYSNYADPMENDEVQRKRKFQDQVSVIAEDVYANLCLSPKITSADHVILRGYIQTLCRDIYCTNFRELYWEIGDLTAGRLLFEECESSQQFESLAELITIVLERNMARRVKHWDDSDK
jgi:hypothetical protein